MNTYYTPKEVNVFYADVACILASFYIGYEIGRFMFIVIFPIMTLFLVSGLDKADMTSLINLAIGMYLLVLVMEYSRYGWSV